MKIYNCPTCDKKYTHKKNLDIHVDAKHSGKPPEKCEKCPATFICKSHLCGHEASVHNQKNKPECPFWRNVLSNKYALKRHIETVHK